MKENFYWMFATACSEYSNRLPLNSMESTFSKVSVSLWLSMMLSVHVNELVLSQWYCIDRVWAKEAYADESDSNPTVPSKSTESAGASEDDADPGSFTEVADESRDKCCVCGLKFNMFFDNEDGVYKYRNCREIEVMNDDVAENESEMMLAHFTCWRGLGSPATLDIDQTLRD